MFTFIIRVLKYTQFLLFLLCSVQGFIICLMNSNNSIIVFNLLHNGFILRGYKLKLNLCEVVYK